MDKNCAFRKLSFKNSMQTPVYIIRIDQLYKAEHPDKHLFESVYNALRDHHQIEDPFRRWRFQDDFSNAIKKLLTDYPIYGTTLRRLVKGDDKLEYVREDLIRYISGFINDPDLEIGEEPFLKRNKFTPTSLMALSGYSQSDMVRFMNRDYLIMAEKEQLRIIDFGKREQVTFRQLTGGGSKVPEVVACKQPSAFSVVHFITIDDAVIHGWHLNDTKPVFTREISGVEVILNANGTILMTLCNGIAKQPDGGGGPVVEVSVYDLSRTEENHHLTLPDCQINQVQVSSDMTWLYVKDNNYSARKSGSSYLLIWPVYDNSVSLRMQIKNKVDLTHGFSMTANGHFLMAADKSYALPDLRFHTRYPVHPNCQRVLSKDDRYLAFYENRIFRFFETQSGYCIGKVVVPAGLSHFTKGYFNSDGGHFCAHFNDMLLIWDIGHMCRPHTKTLVHDETIQLKKVREYGIHQWLERESHLHTNYVRAEWLAMITNQVIRVASANQLPPSGSEGPDYVDEKAGLTVYNYGIYNAASQSQTDAPGQAALVVNQAVLSETTASIKGKIGTCFGLHVLTPAEQPQRIHQFKIKVNHPEMKDAASGRAFVQTSWDQNFGSGMPFFLGWTFETVDEIKAGDWHFEVWDRHAGQLLLRKTFVVATQETQHYLVEPIFTGLYLPHESAENQWLSTRLIVADRDSVFGCRLKMTAPGFQGYYQLRGEISEPEADGGDEPKAKREELFQVRDGDAFNFIAKADWQERLSEGKWTFRLWDDGHRELLLEEHFEVVSAAHLPSPSIELCDRGEYQLTVGHNNHSATEQLQLVEASQNLLLKEDLIFGFRVRLAQNQVGIKRRLRMDLFHPKVSTFFSQSDHQSWFLYVGKEERTFVGFQLNRQELLVEGQWRFVLTDTSAPLGSRVIVEKSFHLRGRE
ncbi:MAG: DUF3859 domain-containing protein [Marinilabiliaceae bacterium]|nr:DUF3859 domain-containing protein [Marinilabiliaceae bacterium]